MDFGYVFMFLGISILSSLSCKNSAIGMIERLGTNSRRYPKGYITPAKWVRTLFRIKQRFIPRFLYFELILSLFFVFLGPINLMICVISDCAPDIVGILVMFHICLVIFNLAIMIIFTILLKRQ
jgi:hypothetical protein